MERLALAGKSACVPHASQSVPNDLPTTGASLILSMVGVILDEIEVIVAPGSLDMRVSACPGIAPCARRVVSMPFTAWSAGVCAALHVLARIEPVMLHERERNVHDGCSGCRAPLKSET